MTDAEGGGLWPVKGIASHRHRKDNGAIEYRVQWLGFDKAYDSWRESDTLAGIAPLLSEYCERYGLFTPEPRTPLPHDQLVQGRPDVPPENSETPDEQEQNLPPAQETAPSGADGAEERDTAQTQVQPSAGDRVRVHYPLDNEWWKGTVVRTRWAKSKGKWDRRVIIVYDDPRYDFEQYEHSTANSTIEVLSRPDDTARAQRVQQLLARTT